MSNEKAPTERSSFTPGNANAPTQNKKSEADVTRSDEYGGSYKSSCDGVSDDQKWGGNQNPVQNESLPAKNLNSAGS